MAEMLACMLRDSGFKPAERHSALEGRIVSAPPERGLLDVVACGIRAGNELLQRHDFSPFWKSPESRREHQA
jgi:hypothetical protein